MVRVKRAAWEGCPAPGSYGETGIKQVHQEGPCPPPTPEGEHRSSGAGYPPPVLPP